ncbi:hypothetical protein Hanom_Chr01g00075081 [Helianthus anomalus]
MTTQVSIKQPKIKTPRRTMDTSTPTMFKTSSIHSISSTSSDDFTPSIVRASNPFTIAVVIGSTRCTTRYKIPLQCLITYILLLHQQHSPAAFRLHHHLIFCILTYLPTANPLHNGVKFIAFEQIRVQD